MSYLRVKQGNSFLWTQIELPEEILLSLFTILVLKKYEKMLVFNENRYKYRRKTSADEFIEFPTVI